MIYGRFGNTTGRPYVEGRISIKKLSIAANVSFLADTGADCSVLMPIDGVRLNVPYDKLLNKRTSYGIGGKSEDFVEKAHVAIYDQDGFIYTYYIDLTICPLTAFNASIPSLLGRDIMNSWNVSFDQTNKLLTAEVFGFTSKNAARAPVPLPAITLPQ